MSLKDEVAVIPDELGDSPPRLFLHIINVYNAMLKASEEREDGVLIWQGKLTNFLEEEVGVAQSQYSRVIKILTSMDCIVRLRRGSGSVLSQWAIIGPPTYENYEYYRKREGYKREKRVDPKEQVVNDLRREMNILTQRMDRLVLKVGVPETPEEFEAMFRDVDAKAEAAKLAATEEEE